LRSLLKPFLAPCCLSLFAAITNGKRHPQRLHLLLLYTILILVLILLVVQSYIYPIAIWVTKLTRTTTSQCIVLQQHVESMEILCSSHIFQYVIVNIITKGPFKNTFLSFTKNLHVVSDSSILGFWDWSTTYGKISWMYGRKRNWPRIRMMHHIELFGLTTIQSWHWDLIALSTCPCYIALDGSSRNGAAPAGALAVHSDGDCFDFCRRQWLQVWSRNSL
jgi:hypothetical protein